MARDNVVFLGGNHSHRNRQKAMRKITKSTVAICEVPILSMRHLYHIRREQVKLRYDHRPRAAVGKNFAEQGVARGAAENVGTMHTAPE